MERSTSQTQAQKISSTDWLLVAIPGIIWGASFLFIAEGLRSVAPNGVTFTRISVEPGTGTGTSFSESGDRSIDA